ACARPRLDPPVEELGHVRSATCCYGRGHLLEVAVVWEGLLGDDHVWVLGVELGDELVHRLDAGGELVLPVGYLRLGLGEAQEHPSHYECAQHLLHSLDVLSRSHRAPTLVGCVTNTTMIRRYVPGLAHA